MERDHQKGAISAFTVLVGYGPKPYCRQSWSLGWMRRAAATEAFLTILSSTSVLSCSCLLLDWSLSSQQVLDPPAGNSQLWALLHSPPWTFLQDHATAVREGLKISRKGYRDLVTGSTFNEFLSTNVQTAIFSNWFAFQVSKATICFYFSSFCGHDEIPETGCCIMISYCSSGGSGHHTGITSTPMRSLRRMAPQ